MYKNQLQELAQRSCFNLPAYSCIREGPDHAPRFKATVNFNGEIFESPNYCATLRQAEHAAAEVALNVLLKRGPSQSLAAKVLDETGICKNLLQETAQRVGVSLPVYTTIKGGLGHVPVFSCVVEVGGRVFAGEPAKTKKQAEKNAAMTAWSVIKQLTQPPLIRDCDDSNADEGDRKYSKGVLALHKREDRDQQMQPLSRYYGGRSRLRMVNVRERNRLSRESSPAGQYQSPGPTPASSPPTGERSYESQRFLFNQQPGARSIDLARSGATHQRSHSLTGIDTSLLPLQEATTLSRGALVSGGGYLGRVPLPWQHHQRPSRLSLQSCSDRFELRRPFTEELQLLEREGDNDWLGTLDSSTSMHLQPQQHRQQKPPANMLESGNPCLQNRRALFQSQSERFELKPSLLDELYRRDEEDWWFKGEMMQRERNRAAAMYDCRDKGTYMFYDGNRRSSTSTDDISYSSSYNDDLGTIGSSNRDAVCTPIAGRFAKQSSFSGYDEVLDLPSSYTDFNTTSPTASYAGDKVSSYGSFNVDARATSFFNEDVSKSTFSGYSNAASSSSNINDDDKGASSSTSIWSPPTQWSMAHLPASPSSTSSTGVQSLGLRPASSIAPPVRVRQMVAVCSAPPPRSMAIDNTGGTHAHALHGRAPSLHDTSSVDAEIATSELFNQLRL